MGERDGVDTWEAFTMKTINKPWGKELWLELNDKYCYKRIHINKGHRTSFQYHEKKLETNYIIKGKAEIWLEDDKGEIQKTIMKEGDHFTVHPPKKHRVIALTDIILQEVSTPEVDDVIRIEDDANRSDGKIEHEHSKLALCIITCGLGTRMGKYSSFINKGLLPINNKAIISHLIDKTADDVEIVIALGYKGDMVREYCLAMHPSRNFIFVEVDKYDDSSVGPAYSLNKCKEHLQRPFYFATSDTYIANNLPRLDNNWLGLSPTSIPELYSTAKLSKGQVTDFKNKSSVGHEYAFIGLAGIYDYKMFWEKLDVTGGEVVSAFYDISQYESFRGEMLDWYDVGTIDNYNKAKQVFETGIPYSIPKSGGEYLYKNDKSFIKLFSDSSITEERTKRVSYLPALTPSLSYEGKNVYAYDWIPGKTLYEINKPSVWKQFLGFLQEEMWASPTSNSPSNIKHLCSKFYKEKTEKRLDMFLSNRKHTYGEEHVVNGAKTRSISSLLSKLDWDYICDGVPTNKWHGDLQFDNVVYGDDSKFYLIDWRHNFGGSTELGDVYYDLSKLYGGVIMSYSLMKDEQNFHIKAGDRQISFEYKMPKTLKNFKKDYERWIIKEGWDLDKVKLITSLIFLNMAPLHEDKFGDILFFKSKTMLEKYVDK